MGKNPIVVVVQGDDQRTQSGFYFPTISRSLSQIIIIYYYKDLVTPLSHYINDFKNRSHWLWDIFISIFGSNACYLFALETFNIFKRK